MPVMARPPPGHPQAHSFDEFDTFSRSSSQSPPDNDELWADPDELLAIPAYDVSAESVADPLFPSPHKFNLMVQDYLRNLSPKKREKALLTQKMYDAVLAVLQDPKDTSTKTAQFRFWAKKMFQLTSFGGEKVVCHDHKPVAVKEQIYEVLCHCHGQAGHGGRDKTSAQVRRYYSWIPKEIIARFVRDCPFCQSRRTQSSAGLSNMSESQAFLISLQTSDTQLASKRPVTLAQARANAAALGHKPYRRPSIRTIDSCRSRRGSAVSDDGYIQYTDAQYASMGIEMDPSFSSQDSAYAGDEGTIYVQGFEFGVCPTDSGAGLADNGSSFGSEQAQFQVQASGGLYPYPPPMPRRASSYHDQIMLNVRPGPESMIRRNSESNIGHLVGGPSTSTMLYSNPPSAMPDMSGGNRFLSVPGMSSLSRNTSSSSLNSLHDDTLSDIDYFTQHLHIDAATDMASGVKVEEYRDNSVYSVSGSVTPLEGSFPLSVHMQGIDVSLFPSQYTDQSYGSSTYSMPHPNDYSFSTLNAPPTSDETLQMMSNWESLPQASIGAKAEAMAAVQRMFDSNNIFALGEAAGMSQDQVIEMHNADPGMLDLNDLRTQMEALETTGTLVPTTTTNDNMTRPGDVYDVDANTSAELEAIKMLALAARTPVSSGMANTISNASSADFTKDDQAFEQMERDLAQVNDDPTQLLGSGPGPAPKVVIEQPMEENMFLFTSMTGYSGAPAVFVEEPKSELSHATEMDLSNWAGFAMS